MRTLAILTSALLGIALVGCTEKNPQEEEASKYPQVKPLSDAEMAKAHANDNAAHAVAPPTPPPTH